MSDPIPPLIPAGVTPGSGALEPDPVEPPAAAGPPICPSCAHPVDAHTGGRCLIMLGDYGTEGPCPCPAPLP